MKLLMISRIKVDVIFIYPIDFGFYKCSCQFITGKIFAEKANVQMYNYFENAKN